jgi:uncharacterized protein YycO
MANKESLKEASKVLDVGDVILTHNTENPLSIFIADITNSKYSHVVMYVGNGLIAESSVYGTVIVPLEKYFKGKHDIAIMRHLFVTPEERKELVQSALRIMGKRYGYLQLFWYLFIRLIGKSESPKWQLDLEPNAMVCSEAIAVVYKELGYDIKPGFETAGVEPVDFWQSEQFTCLWED